MVSISLKAKDQGECGCGAIGEGNEGAQVACFTIILLINSFKVDSDHCFIERNKLIT